MLTSLLANASNTINWGSLITADSFDGITTGVSTVLPVVIPVAITLMAIPIVWGFVRKMIKKH